jgi:hypothetical protein
MLPSDGIRRAWEPWTRADVGEVAQYLRWEYGEGTTVGFLKGQIVQRGRSRRSTTSGLIKRLRGISAAIRGRVVARLTADLQREMGLLVQWKRGELGSDELVIRLEELELEARVPPNLCP